MRSRMGGARVVGRLGSISTAALVLLGTPAWSSGTAPVAEAVKHRDTQRVAKLLQQQHDVNAPQPDGATALHWAAHWDDLAVAEQLIRAGANVNAANDYGVTPLFLACSDGGPAMVERLLAAGANPNVALPDGETALMAAARTGKAAAVTALLARGAAVNAKEGLKGQTALMWAVAEHHLAVVRTLLEHGADVAARSTNGSTPLLFAARYGDIDSARLLLAHGADVNERDAAGTAALVIATVRGHVELARLLLEQGADPNADGAGYTALHWAAGRWETGFTTDYSFAPATTPEWAAVAGLPPHGKVDLIGALIARGADVNARLKRVPPRSGRTLFKNNLVRGATPFFLAALVGDVETMQLLLTHGADPSATASDGTTALMVAAGLAHQDNESLVPESSYLEAVKALVSLGADIHAVNAEGWNALHSAAYVGHQTVVRYLLDQGADLNAVNKWGQTALGMAEGYCNMRSVGGRILPMAACIIGFRPEMAEFLRKLGARSEGRVELNAAGELIVTSSASVAQTESGKP